MPTLTVTQDTILKSHAVDSSSENLPEGFITIPIAKGQKVSYNWIREQNGHYLFELQFPIQGRFNWFLFRGHAKNDDLRKVIGIENTDLAFRLKVIEIADRLNIDPNWLMACMSFETGGTFSPSIKNIAGSGATGLIQFVPSTAQGLGTSVEALAQMTAIDQLDWVEKYFQPYKGRIRSLEDCYMAILFPAAIGKGKDHVLFSGGIAYRQNAGLDANRDGRITVGEATAKVRSRFVSDLVSAEFRMKLSRSPQLVVGTLTFFYGVDRLLIAAATSGAPGYQYFGSWSVRGKGVIPPALDWKIDIRRDFESNVRGVEGRFFPIFPDRFGRSALGLHRDANAPGSAGCIVVRDSRVFNNEVVPLLDRLDDTQKTVNLSVIYT